MTKVKQLPTFRRHCAAPCEPSFPNLEKVMLEADYFLGALWVPLSRLAIIQHS
jgi:hypothetical protein